MAFGALTLSPGLGFGRRNAAGGGGPAIPVNSVAPAVTGSGTTASPLSATNGTWSNSPTGYTYQWLRNGSAISGATASTYTYVLADSGTNITAQVTASNAVGAGSPATSNAIAAGTIAAATFTRATDQPAGILADHTTSATPKRAQCLVSARRP
jgi:hypothetical protein